MQSTISRLLRQRGHRVTAEGSEKDILLPDNSKTEEKNLDLLKNELYNLMSRESNRKALRDWAWGHQYDSAVPMQRINSYFELCDQFGDWKSEGSDARQMRYAKTFEWYISEMLRREFASRASGFSIRLKDALPEDEFDCIAVLDEGVVFAECKTGENDIYKDVAKFIRRDTELSADYSFYLVDREYIFSREGNDRPTISRERARELGILGIFQVSVGSRRFFEIISVPRVDTGRSRYLLAFSAFKGLEERIRYMIRYQNEVRRGYRTPSSLYKREEIFCYGPDPRSIF